MSIKCRRPLLNLCGEVSRISIALGACRTCPTDEISLRIEQAGCAVVEQYCEEETIAIGCLCGDPVEITDTRIKQREVPKLGVNYPLHEIDSMGNAVFVIDNKFHAMGPGRYVGVVSFGDSEERIDINYSTGGTRVRGIVAVATGGANV